MIVNKQRELFNLVRLSGLLSVLFSVTTLAQLPVMTSLEIESEVFLTVSSEQMLVDVQQQVGELLAQNSENKFGFLEWQAKNSLDIDDDDQSDGVQLIITMRNKDNQICTPAVDLHWSAIINERVVQLDRIVQESLYAACSADIPFFETERLVGDINDAVINALMIDANRKYITDKILSDIPIADRLDNHENIMLLLPISSTKLKADSGSQLQARFLFDRQTSNPVPGILELRTHDGFEDSVSLKVHQIDVPSVNGAIEEGNEHFPAVMPRLLENAIDFRIFMTNYLPNNDAGSVISGTSVASELSD